MKHALAALPIALLATMTAGQGIDPRIPTPVHDWGCEVLLCLANPDGPMAVAECRPPIERLWRHLARGHSMPSCTMASGPGGRSYARPGWSPYDRCPEGSQPLPPGELAVLAAPMQPTTSPAIRRGTLPSYDIAAPYTVYTGTGDQSARSDLRTNTGAMVCIAAPAGMRTVGAGDNAVEVMTYQRIYVGNAVQRPRYIDVFIDDRYWQRVRW